MLNRKEIDESDFKNIRPKHAKPGRAHGLPKIHKQFQHLPPFRPIVDTTGSTHYGVGKYLSSLLNPLTTNQYTVKDSFDAAQRIKAIPKHLFENGSMFVSFDVTSLFTNVPLKRTVDIIEDRIYNSGLIDTKLSKRSLRKLIIDTCTKTVFSCNNKLYEQIDGVSMGSSLGPVLANIIMTELESLIITPLIDSGIIEFYCRYVDDTLLIIKPENIDFVHHSLNSFDTNLQFTVDTFENETPHFLDLQIAPDGLSIFRKVTNTGLYTDFDSYTPWSYRKAWISSLANRAFRICSANKLKNEIKTIKKFASWNNFPRHVANKLIEIARENLTRDNDMPDINDDNVITLWLRIPYAGKEGDDLISALKRKLKSCVQKGCIVKFKLLYSTTKLSYFTNMKDRTETLYKSNVVYKFTCPGCKACYIGKTERNLYQRCIEHATTKESAVHDHLLKCEQIAYQLNLFTMNLDDFNPREIYINLVNDNTSIIDSSDNWNNLLLKEALYIKRETPLLNNGLKASRELCLF